MGTAWERHAMCESAFEILRETAVAGSAAGWLTLLPLQYKDCTVIC